jgi:hypothetical protein
LAVERIDHEFFGRMIGRFAVLAGDIDGPILRIVVGLVEGELGEGELEGELGPPMI